MENVFFVLIIMIVIVVFHELGHIIMAKILGLKIYNVGVALKPIPHVFVGTAFTQNKMKRTLFYLGGPFITILLFLMMIIFGLTRHTFINIAFVLSVIIESNPFFSDYTTLILLHKLKGETPNADFFKYRYSERLTAFYFTGIWYLFFFTWSILGGCLLKFGLLNK
ncbi:MAG: hypothetical protein K2Q03_01275 [Sphingobacteriaceae bacterium]|nr:hypothetical protein [Sphingobacteriaceae bacterium]